jgi:putative ABC transport system substrate-binding protein
VARGQQGDRLRRVGFLSFGAESGFPIAMLRDELQAFGWIEGRNLQLDVCFGDSDVNRTRGLAAEMVKLAPDVIITVYGQPLRFVQQLTKSIPIVVVGGGERPLDTTPRPGGNITGFPNSFDSLGSKWLQLLKEAAPNITRVANLFPLENSANAYQFSIETAAQSLGLQFVKIPVSAPADMRAAIEGFAAEPRGALVVNPGMSAIAPLELIALAAQFRLPAIYGSRFFPAAGGLMSYNSDVINFRGVASYVDRLLRGASVSDLPVQFPTKFRLVINLKTAKTLGLTIPNPST